MYVIEYVNFVFFFIRSVYHRIRTALHQCNSIAADAVTADAKC